MSELKTVIIDVKDIVEELREENKRLLKQLLFSEKCIKLFEKYRKSLESFNNNCICDQNIENKLLFNYLENEYKVIFEYFNKEVQNEEKLFDDNFDKKLMDFNINNTNVNKVSVNKCLVKNVRKSEKMTNKCLINKKNESNKKPMIKNEEQINYNENKTTIYSEYDSNSVETQISAKIEGYYWCQFKNCDFKSDDKSKVKKHINGLHANKVPIVCDECQQSFWKPNRLSEHIKSDHMESYDSTNNKFKCNFNVCSFQTESIRDYLRHKKRHSGVKSFKCDYGSCEWNFFTIHELKNHKKYSHSSEKPFVCDWKGCNARFKQNKYLNYHRFSHTGQMPFRCEWPGCDAGFAFKSALEVHKSSHIGNKTFICDWPECGMKFTFNANLKNHYSVHTNEKPFACEWPGCEARFRLNAKLKSHKLVHKTGCDFACFWPQCGKQFRSKPSLKLHIMGHKGEKPFKCESIGCDMRFKDRRQMRKHFKRKHIPK